MPGLSSMQRTRIATCATLPVRVPDILFPSIVVFLAGAGELLRHCPISRGSSALANLTERSQFSVSGVDSLGWSVFARLGAGLQRGGAELWRRRGVYESSFRC